MRVLPAEGAVFAALRASPPGGEEERVLCVINASMNPETFAVSQDVCGRPKDAGFMDIISGEKIVPPGAGDSLELELAPFAVRWIRL
jgi:hypothetical protein